MLSKLVKKSFSTTQGKGKFNIFSSYQNLKSAIRAPVKHFKRFTEPSAQDYQPWTNTTQEAFDEVSQEWQALIVGNPYDVNTFNYLEANSQGNFGTVDNPHVILTSDAPYRYVICTGVTNEDDYEGHEALFFMLKEGPLQRCQSCGQVWKLVRIRNEFSPEHDYYLSNMLPYEQQEMGEMDQAYNMSTFKMNTHFENTQFETPSNRVYHLINPDEHDRILTDPAYRLEKTKQVHNKIKVYLQSLHEVDSQFVAQNGPLPRTAINRVDYVTLIEAEKAIMKLDRLFRKVDKFNNRKYIDLENHERREKRMLAKKQERWDSNYTLYFGEATEEEQQYRDYYETDIERFPENENEEERLDELDILERDSYKLENFDFQENYTRQPEDDQGSLMERLSFKFKYRIAGDSYEVFENRNKRMTERSQKRFQDNKIRELQSNYHKAVQANNEKLISEYRGKYLEFVADESIRQYKDYYEDDVSQDLSVFDNATGVEREQMINSFENVLQSQQGFSGSATLPKRKWNPAFGVWQNFLFDFKDFNMEILPRAKFMSNEAQKLEFVGDDKVLEDKSKQTKKISDSSKN